MEWKVETYEWARWVLKEALAFIKEGLGMANALQVDMLAAGVVDASGAPLPGGKVYTYAAGGTTDKAVYTDSGMTTPATNPVILDAAGVAEVYAYGNYDFHIYDSADVLVRTLENQYYMIPVSSIATVSTVTAATNLTAVEQLVKVNTAGGNITVYMPTAVGNEGLRIAVLKTSASNTVTIDADTLYSQTINGAATQTITANNGIIEMLSDNSNWVIVNSNASGAVTLTGTQTLDNKTLTAPVINGTTTGTPTFTGVVDIYTTDWTDYSATSTIVGFSGYTYKYIYYKLVGKMCHVLFNLSGTSNSTAITFTLPNAMLSTGIDISMTVTAAVKGYDNAGALAIPSMAVISRGGSTVTVYKDWTAASSAWTASSAKAVSGYFIYPVE